MYIAQVLQDPNSEEAGSGSGEDDGQGSSQDEEIINVQNGLNADFQSGEDSLIDNEVRHWFWWRKKKRTLEYDLRSALISCNKTFTEGAVLQSISTSLEGLHTNKHTVSQGLNGLFLRDRSLGLAKFCHLSYLQRKFP